MARYNPNPAGIRAMLATPAMMEAMRRKAEQAKAYAESIAPVDTGRYKASLEVTAEVVGTRARARLHARAPYSVYVEYPHRVHNSTRVVAGQHILGRSLDALRTT